LRLNTASLQNKDTKPIRGRDTTLEKAIQEIRDITEGKCSHYLFGYFSIYLFAKEYSKLNGNPSINFAGRNTWKCATLQIYV